jgi:hypothetical protein
MDTITTSIELPITNELGDQIMAVKVWPGLETARISVGAFSYAVTRAELREMRKQLARADEAMSHQVAKVAS